MRLSAGRTDPFLLTPVMSDVSQSIVRASLLAAMTALFMGLWSSDSRQTAGWSVAERNRRIVPAHALARHDAPRVAQMARAARRFPAGRRPSVTPPAVAAARPEIDCPAGRYRMVFADGRVEWLRIIDRQAVTAPAAAGAEVFPAIVGGERVHLIRVSESAALETAVR